MTDHNSVVGGVPKELPFITDHNSVVGGAPKELPFITDHNSAVGGAPKELPFMTGLIYKECVSEPNQLLKSSV